MYQVRRKTGFVIIIGGVYLHFGRKHNRKYNLVIFFYNSRYLLFIPSQLPNTLYDYLYGTFF